MVEPVFEENGYAEVIFPKGHKWVYYFDHNRVFEGLGVRQSLGFKLSEAPMFIRSNSVVPIKDELWLVYPSKGQHSKQVIAGDYSDAVTISNEGQQMEILVSRFYKNEEVRQSRQDKTLKIRIIGVARPHPRSAETVVEATEYANEYYVTVELNKNMVMQFGQ